MPRAVPVELTNMCMVCDGSRVLLEERTDSAWPGAAFPGGHIEAGESVVASVIREVREETGLTVESPKLCGIKDRMREGGYRYLVLLFRASRFSGNLRPSAEGRVFWAERSELAAMELAPSMREVLALLEDDGLSELYNTACSGAAADAASWVLL